MSDHSEAGDYHGAGARLDAHVSTCETCRVGEPCGDGDEIAEREFRAWRAWERTDTAGARAYRRQAAR